MARYRIYLLNRVDRIYGFREARCPSDAHVLQTASRLLSEAPGVEIWEDARFVARLPPRATVAGTSSASPSPAQLSAPLPSGPASTGTWGSRVRASLNGLMPG